MSVRALFTGTVAALEDRFLSLMGEEVRSSWKRAPLVLCGSHLLAASLRRRAAGAGVPLLNVRFCTFDSLAADLLPPDYRGRKLISPLGELLLLERILSRSAGYFGPVAARAGFRAALLAALQDLADGGIERIPPALAAHDPKLGTLARIFESFRSAMAPFVSRSGALALAARHASRLEEVFQTRSLIVYGLYDFTHLQAELLRAAAQCASLTALVPYRAGGACDFALDAVLFFRSLAPPGVVPRELQDPAGGSASLAALRGGWAQHPGATVPREPQVSSARGGPGRAPPRGAQPVQAHLLGAADPAMDEGAVRIVSAPDEAGEIAEICRQVQCCARQGIDFAEMAVLLRRPETYTQLIQDQFSAAGIPYYLQSTIPLSATLQGRSLLLLLELLDTDLPRAAVMEFAAFAPLRWRRLLPARLLEDAGMAVSPHAWDHLSARIGMTAGPGLWQRLDLHCDSLRRELARRPDPDAPAAFPLRLDLFHAETLAAFVEGLRRWQRRLAGCRTWRDFSLRTDGAIRAFFSGAASPAGGPDPAGGRIWDQLRETARAMATLDQAGPVEAPAQRLSALRAALDHDPVSVGRFQDGGVGVLSVMGARGTRHRVVLIPGLTEREFPLPAGQDPILLDSERAAITRADGQGRLPHKSRRPLEERLLFDLCLGAAREQLVLTFPRADAQSDRPRLPSHYLLRTAEILSGAPCDSAGLEQLSVVRRVPLSRLAPEREEDALTESEFALAALEPAGGVPRSLYQARLARSLESQRARWSRSFTPFDGYLRLQELRSHLEAWTADRLFSPSGLERFAACPYQFFLRYLLRLQAVEEPENLVRLSPRDRGTLIHSILEEFLRGAQQRGGSRPEELRRLMRETAQEHFRRAAHSGITGARLLWEIDAEMILRDLDAFAAREADRTSGFLPSRLEAEFGRGAPPLVLALPRSGQVRVGGRIDRIDADPAGRLRVVDYKTGLARPEPDSFFRQGKALQLPLYLLAAAGMHGVADLRGSRAEYWFVSGADAGAVHALEGEALARRRTELEEILDLLLGAMREGRFPADPGPDKSHCAICDYGLVCDNARERIHKAKLASGALRFQERLRDYP